MPFKHVLALHVFTDQEQIKSKGSYVGILSTTNSMGAIRMRVQTADKNITIIQRKSECL